MQQYGDKFLSLDLSSDGARKSISNGANTMRIATLFRRVSGTVAAASLALAVGMGDASAATQTGWVGPTPPGEGGQLYLTTSTINNAPLEASSRIYTAFGNSVPTAQMGVQARLFKSGVLCQITSYVFNPLPANQISTNTYGNCGSGSYNSHGFVKYWTGTAYGDFLTFPTDPLNFTAPPTLASKSPTAAPKTDSATNSQGLTIGSAETAQTENDQPDLIAAYGTGGEAGYIKKTDLAAQTPATPTEAAKATDPAPSTIPLYAENGSTVIGSFTIQ